MRVLDLFSGIGGFSLGLERAGMQTVQFCEIDPFCQAVLKKHWPDVPCHDDVRTLPVVGCDLICGGFPCQPWSTAGRRKGEGDDRHLWPAMLEVIRRERPSWVCGENVAGIIAMGLDQVLDDLESLSYTCRTFVIPAVAVGAPHRRDRIWIVAHAVRGVRSAQSGQQQGQWAALTDSGGKGDVAHSISRRPRPHGNAGNQKTPGEREATEPLDGRLSDFWSAEPDVGRVAHGVPARVHRLRALGNSIVPQIAEMIGRAILKHNGEQQ